MLEVDGVVAELQSRGLHVGERKLRDWRRKGLLPSLNRRGLGRGRGTSEYWEEPWIIDQAATVYRALSKHRYARKVFLVLPSLGFPVSVPQFRDALCRWLAEFDLRVDADEAASDPAGHAELLDLYARLEMYPRLAKRPDVLPEAFHRLTLQMFHNPAYELPDSLAGAWGTGPDAQNDIRWYQEHGSGPVLHQAVTQAGDQHLSQVLSGWHEFMLWASSSGMETGWDIDADMLHVGPVEVEMRLMPWLFLVDLGMRVSGSARYFLVGFVLQGILEKLGPNDAHN